MALLPHRTARALCLIVALTFLGKGSPLLADTVTGITGGNQPLDNHQPSLAMSYMIAVAGTPPDNAGTGPAGNLPPNRTQAFLGEIKAIPFHHELDGWMLCEGQSLLAADYADLFGLIGYTFGGSGANFNLPDLRGRVPIGAGQGPGFPNYPVGAVVGTNYPVLSVANLPAHTHTIPGGNTATTGSGAPLDNRQPSLALHFLIAANGEIMIAPWPHEPTGWAHCDGRLLSSASYGYLYSFIGTTYGGNGSPNFALPDLRGRVVTGDGFLAVGLAHGVLQNALNVAAIAAHTHTITGGNTGSTGGTGATADNIQPSLVMRWRISNTGPQPTQGAAVTFPMVGEMRLIAGLTADGIPDNAWIRMWGDHLNIFMNTGLYLVLGQTYGGDNVTTFALPDLRSTVAVGDNDDDFVLGGFVGSETLFISVVAQLAAHSHSLLQLRFTDIQHFANGSVQLTLAGTALNTCQVQWSEDFVTWTNLGTVTFNNATEVINDPNSSNAPKRFYQAYFP